MPNQKSDQRRLPAAEPAPPRAMNIQGYVEMVDGVLDGQDIPSLLKKPPRSTRENS